MAKNPHVHKRIVLFFLKEVFEGYLQDRITLPQALTMLEVTRTTFFRHLKLYRRNPSEFTIGYSRSPSPRKCTAEQDKTIVNLLRTEQDLISNPDVRVGKYNFPALALELEQTEQIHLSSETLRKKAIEWNMHRPKVRGKKIYREVETTKIGRLFQHDTCIHKWSPLMDYFYLILTVDDHSRRIVYARFFTEENSMNHILAVRDTVQKFGLPLAYYTDRHSIFTYTEKQGAQQRNYRVGGEDAEVQWKRVLRTLSIQGICAQSPQAKGKVESKFKYLQGRVVRRCAKEEVTTMVHAQRILDEEVQHYNDCRIHDVTGETPLQRFLHASNEGRSVLRPYTPVEKESWKDIFCLEYEKKLDAYGRIKIKGHELQIKSCPTKTVTVRFIEENGEKEVRILSKNAIVKSIRI